MYTSPVLIATSGASVTYNTNIAVTLILAYNSLIKKYKLELSEFKAKTKKIKKEKINLLTNYSDVSFQKKDK